MIPSFVRKIKLSNLIDGFGRDFSGDEKEVGPVDTDGLEDVDDLLAGPMRRWRWQILALANIPFFHFAFVFKERVEVGKIELHRMDFPIVIEFLSHAKEIYRAFVTLIIENGICE